jgi:predicted PurR-regulated permease PerM
MEHSEKKTFTLDRVVRIIIGILLLLGTGLLINRLSAVLLPFLLAWLLAYLMYPLMKFYQYKLRFKSRILSITAVLLTVFSVLSLALILLVPPIIDQTQKAIQITLQLIPEAEQNWNLPPALVETIRSYINQFSIENIGFDNMQNLVRELLPRAWSLLTGAGSFLLNIVIVFMVLLYLIFILKDYENISEGWSELIPKQYRHFVLQVGEDLKNGMNRYFRGQALIALTVGILFAIGFSIIKLPMGLAFGLMVGFMNLIPYLQTFAIPPALMLAAIKSAETGQEFLWVAVAVFAVFGIVQTIQEVLLNPKILGDATGLNPAVILLSLSIWGSLFGVVGMILALPMTTLLISYYNRFVIQGGMIEKWVEDPDKSNHSTDGSPTR